MECNNPLDENNVQGKSRHLLEVTNATLSIKDVTLFSEISFDLNAGEILTIVGPNGAGKSSLLKALASDHIISKGEIQLSGVCASEIPLAERARTLAVLPQLSLLNFPYTVEEVVSLGRIPHSTGFSYDKAVVLEAMERLDISHLSQRLYTQLSGGEKQRAQLARVMVQIWPSDTPKERILMLDEPTTALDLGHQQQLMTCLREFTCQGVGVLMVLHDINLAIRYSDRILALKDGRCLAAGTPLQIATESVMSSLFDANIKIIRDSDGLTYVV